MDQDRNKKNAVDFYDLMFNQNHPRLAVEKFVGGTYIQHNPDVEDGKEGFIKYIDIFRFDENRKIVEHWDVLQTIPKHAKNNNTMF